MIWERKVFSTCDHGPKKLVSAYVYIWHVQNVVFCEIIVNEVI